MGRCYVHAEPLTYTGAMCPVCASEAPSSDEQTIARLRQALAVATHRPHDRNGPPDPPSGWPTCSGCGAIIDPSSAVGTEAQAPVSPIGDTVREYSAAPSLDVERLSEALGPWDGNFTRVHRAELPTILARLSEKAP